MTIETDESLRARVRATSDRPDDPDWIAFLSYYHGDRLDRLARHMGVFRRCPLEPLERLAFAMVHVGVAAEVVRRWEALSPLALVYVEPLRGDDYEVVAHLGPMQATEQLSGFLAHYEPEREAEKVFESLFWQVGRRLFADYVPPRGFGKAHRLREILQRARGFEVKEQEAADMRRRLAKAEEDLVDARTILAEQKDRARRFCEERDEALRRLGEKE